MAQQRVLPTGQRIGDPVVKPSGPFDPTGQPGLGALVKQLRQPVVAEPEMLPEEEEFPSLPSEQLTPDLQQMLFVLKQAQLQRR